ncbi:MAG: hypothetical protein IJF16_10105 [Clostridia bacterium]|nr:hypothetical protein [Clostridia bacterium]
MKDEPKSASETVETVEVISSGSRAAYNFKGSNDVGIFFEGTDINQFSGFAMDFKTTAVDSKDYNVYDANGGVMFTLSKDYLDTLDKGNHTAVIFFYPKSPQFLRYYRAGGSDHRVKKLKRRVLFELSFFIYQSI